MRLSFFLFLLLAGLGSARADDVIVLQHLRFGTWLFPDNDSVYSITVEPDGSYSNSPELTMLSPPNEGIFDIGDLTPNSAINGLDVTQNTPLERGGQNFDMTAFQTQAPGSTDNNGRVTVNLGATANTTGTGGMYAAGLYSGSIDLEFDINF